MNRTMGSLVIATTFATQMAFAGLSGALRGSSGTVGNASRAAYDISAGVVVKASGSIMMISEKASDSTSNAVTGAFQSAANVSVKAIAIGEDSVSMILDFSKKNPVSAGASAVIVSAVTAGGALIPAALTTIGNAIVVSVKTTSAAVSTVFDASSKVVVGSVHWTSESLVKSGKFAMNASGQLIDASGKVVGWVVDASGHAIKLAVTASGKIATVLGNGSEVVITGSTDLLKSVAGSIANVANTTGDVISDLFEASIKVSKLGSLVIVTVSEKATGAIEGSIRFSSQTITNLFDSMASGQSRN